MRHARRMSGRGLLVVGGALVASVVVLPVLLALLLLQEAPVGPAPPAAVATVPVEVSCDGTVPPARSVPTEVVAARLCATDAGLERWYAPQDTLRGDLRPLVDLLVGLQPLPGSTTEGRTFCPDDGGIGFDLRLALASGELVSLAGDTGGCSTVRVGDDDLGGSDGVVAAFVQALVAQRSRSDPPPSPVALHLGCGAGTWGDHRLSLVGDPRELVRAVSCSRPSDGDDVASWGRPVAVRPGDVALLVADMRARTSVGQDSDDGSCRDRAPVDQDLVGQTRWGDVVAVRGACGSYLLSDVTAVAPGDQELWHPSPRARRILEQLRR